MKQLLHKIYAAIPFKRQFFEIVRGLPIPQKLYQHLHFKGTFTVRVDSTHRFFIECDGAIVENELFWGGYGGSWEQTSLKLWAAICRNASGLILDIGANTGTYALAAAALAAKAQVIAFEPVERIASTLRRNVALNHFDIKVEQVAVSDRQGLVPIHDSLDPNNYSASIEGQGSDAACYNVPATSLDAYPLPVSSIAAIKIDVERHEPAAIRGMLRTLERDRPPVLIEILDADIGRAVAAHIAPLGYTFYHISEEKGLLPTDRLFPLGGSDWNHLLCTAEDFERLDLGGFLAAN